MDPANELAIGPAHETVAKSERFLDRARLPEDPRIGDNSRDRAQRERGDAELRIVAGDLLKPGLADVVMGRIFSKRVNQHIDVRQDHLNRPAASRSSIS